ncbi:MAG: hypothetical protein FWH50_00720 [Coriobacteriia bacterium]|nr:hypothetical protein [Coriobacteriia bacterium]
MAKLPDISYKPAAEDLYGPVFRPELLVGIVAILSLLFLLIPSVGEFDRRVEDQEIVWLEQNIQRSAVECYAIEGSYPTTAQGVAYLEDNYGLHVDWQRFVVYYESMGGNLLPQIKVMAIPQDAPLEQINEMLNPLGSGGH